jgi:hypothetical protein
MKTTCSALLISVLLIASGCFAPVNLSFENAELLDKGETKVQASYSSYYGPEYDENSSNLFRNVHYHNNFGVALGYGISNNFNLGLRYERFKPLTEIKIFGEKFEWGSKGFNYLEVGNKIRIKDDKLAVGIPVSLYFIEDVSFFSIDPRIYWTFRSNNKFETTLTPKAHLFFGDEVGFEPGFTLGFGLSDDLDKWAFRPEIGYDGFFSFGFGVNVYLKKQ